MTQIGLREVAGHKPMCLLRPRHPITAPFPGLRVFVFTMRNPSVIIRSFRALLLSLALSAVVASAADVSITPVATGWREAASFKRISEYFSGKENTSGQLILRTHPDQRSGYYFLLRLNHAGAAAGAQAVLQVITPDTATPRIFKFPTDIAAGKTMLNLGLTGPDWPDLKINPVAWKLDLLAADGQLIATDHSYLWENPISK